MLFALIQAIHIASGWLQHIVFISCLIHFLRQKYLFAYLLTPIRVGDMYTIKHFFLLLELMPHDPTVFLIVKSNGGGFMRVLHNKFKCSSHRDPLHEHCFSTRKQRIQNTGPPKLKSSLRYNLGKACYWSTPPFELG